MMSVINYGNHKIIKEIKTELKNKQKQMNFLQDLTES
jgi:hypothetical protein